MTLTVTVINERNELVSTLTKDDFAVFADKVPQKITHFSAGDSPMSIGLLFDASESMGRIRNTEKLKTFKAGLKRFFQSCNSENEYFLIGFNNQPQLLTDWTSDTEVILDRFSSAQFQGQTAFYDACYVGLDKVSHGRYSKRAIILISDGLDNASRYNFFQLRSLLRQVNVVVYSINILNDDISKSSLLAEEGQQILKELSRMSGGMTFYQGRESPRSDALETIFAFISNELRHQYLIGFIPPATQNKASSRRLKVKVNKDPANKAWRKLTIRSREGY